MAERTAVSPYVCGWTTDDECWTKLAGAFGDETKTPMAQGSLNMAAEVLYALSGRQFGVCEVRSRPCRESCYAPFLRTSGYRWTPVFQGGQWFNMSCGACKGSCSCSQLSEIVLPGPVAEITEVLLDGVAMAEGTYRVDNRNRLVRLDGDTWPLCQNMAAESDEPGTFQVTYGRGRPLPEAGKNALGALANELAKACLNDGTCQLPERVTTIVRQGLTMALLDPMEFLTRNRTGIYAVDLWLTAVNPLGRQRHAGVYSPDVAPPRVTTWP